MIKGLPIKSDEESHLVAGVVLLGCFAALRVQVGVHYQRKPLFATLTMFFFIVALMIASFQRAPIKKPGSSIQAFSSRLYE